MTAVSVVMEKQSTDKKSSVQEGSRRPGYALKWIMGAVLLAIVTAGLLVAAFYVGSMITTNDKTGIMENNNDQGRTHLTEIVERVQEHISSNASSHVVRIRVPDQGIVIMDFERKLEIMTFSHIKHVCFVAEMTDTTAEPLSHTDVESNFTIAVKSTPLVDMYIADITYDVTLLPDVAQRICKVAFHAKLSTDPEPARTDRRTKRQCSRSCIMVCHPQTHRCRRQCVRNPCPRRCTRQRPCSA